MEHLQGETESVDTIDAIFRTQMELNDIRYHEFMARTRLDHSERNNWHVKAIFCLNILAEVITPRSRLTVDSLPWSHTFHTKEQR